MLPAFAAAILATAALVACGRGADSGATASPNAQGSPGTGNPTQARAPQAPDGPPGGPSGVKGSAPHPGSSGGEPVAGATGSGTQGSSSGAGLGGGLGEGRTAMGAAPAASAPSGSAAPPGSSNRSSATGSR